MSQAQFNCPSCEESFRAPFEPGYGVACPKCQNTFVPTSDAATAPQAQNDPLQRYGRVVETLGFIALCIGIAIAVYGATQSENRADYYRAGAAVAGSCVVVLILAQLIFIRASLARKTE